MNNIIGYKEVEEKILRIIFTEPPTQAILIAEGKKGVD